MTDKKRCISPKCQGAPLMKSSMESSLSVERWECPRCGRPYNCPTTLTSVSQVAGTASAIAIAGSILLRAFTGDWQGAIEQTAESLDDLFA